MLICYICWTLGTSEALITHNCEIRQDRQGIHYVVYETKHDTPQTIGKFYRTSLVNEESQDEILEVDNSFTRGTLWLNRNEESLVIYNSKGCDEIYR